MSDLRQRDGDGGGLTFKESVRHPQFSGRRQVCALMSSACARRCTTLAIAEEAEREYGIRLELERGLRPADAVILAVAHEGPSRAGGRWS